MFFQGSIQEGISTAVGQQKLLLCFVTDGNDESQTWENEYLQHESVNDLIATKAIALRLEAGSDEAGYLAQIFPLPKTPTVVIMKHGELKEYIASGTSKEDFLRRLSNAFSVGNAATPAPAPSTPAAGAATTAAVPTPNAEASAPSSSSIPSSSPESDGSENVRRILAERATKAQKEAAARQAREAEAAAAAAAAAVVKGKGKGKAVAESTAAPPQTSAQKEAAELIKKKKAQQNDERRRILKRIEDDKTARRELAAQREKKRQEDRAAAESEAKDQQQARTASRASSSSSSIAAIQVRLSDGSTIRNKFPASENVKSIRSWVDKERSDGKGPYFLKQILAPLPNRSIDTTEEGKSLRELGLSPSSTLLLIPIERFAVAYDGQGSSQGFFSRVLGLIFGIFTWLMSLIGLGGETTEAEAQAPATAPANAPAALRNQRVRAFENPNDSRGDQQLYNGNSLNFEPRPDEDEK